MNSGLTEKEDDLLQQIEKVWNSLLELPILHQDDIHEARRDIHNLENRIMSRLVYRNIKVK